MADTDSKPAAPMPQPTDEHKKLYILAGEWEGDENIAPSPWGPGGPAKGFSSIHVAVDGFFVVQDYVEVKDGRTVFRGHGIYGWDAAQQTYTWYWCDSMGQVPPQPSRGRWQGDTLVFESSSSQAQGRYTYRFEGEAIYHFKLENSFDGGNTWLTFMDGTYRKTR
jgi:hypothetical protein